MNIAESSEKAVAMTTAVPVMTIVAQISGQAWIV